ncbi:MAG: T9SS type A sorting domain-containing protein, partial [Bacteroidota bacterium]
VVVETSPNTSLGSGSWLMSAKYRTSVDINGQPETNVAPADGGEYGMGWFPGYAIDVNTGRRLNLFFGESEWDRNNRGNDMIWNPTSELGTNLDRVGGRHYLYVTDLTYDGCESIKDTLMNADFEGINGFSDAMFFTETGHHLKDVYKHVAWMGIPYLSTGYDIADPTQIPTDTRISLRVTRPFVPRGNEAPGTVPEFTFNTIGLSAQTQQIEVAQSALDDILVVPNPYYAFSTYETGQLDNRVRITNLPRQCRISIFTLNGNLVRTFNKESEQTFQDWNLQNQSGVTVASGLYVIHIDGNVGGQNLGEKVIKLMAVMRELDLDNF